VFAELQLPELAYSSHSGTIVAQSGNVPITNVSAYLSEEGEVIITGTIDVMHPQTISNCDITFEDNNGWKIVGKKFSIFEENLAISSGSVSWPPKAAFKAKGWKLIADRGNIRDSDQVNIYNIITDINFADEVNFADLGKRGIKFLSEELKDFALIKTEVQQVPRSVAYFGVSDIYEKFEEKWRNYLDVFLLMFRFAASNFINSPVIYIKNPTGGEHIEMTSYIEYGGRGGRIFYLTYPGTVSDFVNSTFDQFVSLRKKLDLDKLIMYYIMMKNTGFVDNSYLLGCIFMEGLKHSFAKNLKGYPYDSTNHSFLKPNGSRCTFRDLINELYSEFHITHGNTGFIKYRNEVVHEGILSSISFEEILNEKQNLETTIEHLLLNILEYKGLYWDRPTREWVDYDTVVT
jgi:hypothetical protein